MEVVTLHIAPRKDFTSVRFGVPPREHAGLNWIGPRFRLLVMSSLWVIGTLYTRAVDIKRSNVGLPPSALPRNASLRSCFTVISPHLSYDCSSHYRDHHPAGSHRDGCYSDCNGRDRYVYSRTFHGYTFYWSRNYSDIGGF